MPSTIDLLRAAREIVARPDGWGQGINRDQDCAQDALFRVAGDLTDASPPWCILTRLCRQRGHSSIASFNDAKTTRQSMVVGLFDEAIQLAESEAGDEA